ncbi:hypothetical protein C8J56DRAFT_567818 [Mycena floridula]|nr:hypothetical protein C8J56DRAFT_567818 [Mycena floridula]
MPSLWSCIAIYCTYPSTLSILQTALSRARGWPLSLSFCMNHNFSTPTTIEEAVFDTLLAPSHSEQWSQIRLDVCFEFLNILGQVRGRIPLLQNITLLPPLPVVLDAFADAPRLRSVCVGNSASDILALQIPWRQLTCFSSKVTSVDRELQILAKLPNLAEYRLEGEFLMWEPVVDTSSIISLPQLRKLTVMHPSSTAPRLILPALHDIVMSGDNSCLWKIRHIFEISAPTIKYLRFESLSASLRLLAQICKPLVWLTVFECESLQHSNGLIKFLTLEPNESGLLPSLRILTITVRNLTGFQPREILNLIWFDRAGLLNPGLVWNPSIFG